MVQMQDLVKEIRYGIPPCYHMILEDRLAIAWGDQKRHRFNGTAKSKAQILSTARITRARSYYLRAQDEDCLLFLPFVLAYSPRGCADFKITEFAELQKHKRGKIQAEAGPEIKKLLENIAFRKGFCQNRHYLRFIGVMFPAGSLKSFIIFSPN